MLLIYLKKTLFGNVNILGHYISAIIGISSGFLLFLTYRKLYEAYLKKTLSLLKETMNELTTIQLREEKTQLY